jgi:hypothetical protein
LFSTLFFKIESHELDHFFRHLKTLQITRQPWLVFVDWREVDN